MKVEMITTGEEVLSGQIIDTNAAWFSDVLMNLGIELQRRTTVGDRMDDLVAVFLERSREADVILVNGGLGPTSDDLSAEAAASALGESLTEDSEWRRHLEDWFDKRGRVMPANNIKQCMLPKSAIRVDNPSGSAPGFRILLNNAWLFFTPGVPFEFRHMVNEAFIPFLQQEFGTAVNTRLNKLLTLGHGESTLAETLSDVTPPPGIMLGFRPSAPYVEVKLFARGDAAIAQLPGYTSKVREKLGSAIVSEKYPSIAEEVHHLLVSDQRKLAIAESCTGGMLTSMLVDFAGSSTYLEQGLATYSDAAKQQQLQVSEATLREHGAVSVETAREMAQGVRRLQSSDFGLSTTGIAGPEGGSAEKPVGMVCIALAAADCTWIQTVYLSNRSRTLIRRISSAIALDMLRRAVSGEEPLVDYPFITQSDQQHIKETA